MYYQLERSGGSEFGENPTNGSKHNLTEDAFPKRLGLDATIIYFRPKDRILRQMSRIYTNSEICRSVWKSTYQDSKSMFNSTVDGK